MSATGQDTTSSNTKTFVSALITGLVVGGVYLTLFYVLHSRNQKIFQPRSYLGPPQKRVKALPKNVFGWFGGIIREPDIRVGEVNGLDAYFFIRFMRAMIMILLPSWLLTWTILFPVTATKPNKKLAGLDIFSLGNVGSEKKLVAHLLVAITLIVWTLFVLYREFNHFARVRLGYLASSSYAADPRSRSVMITNLPAQWETEQALRDAAAFVGAPVERVWFIRKVKPLEKLFDEREKQAYKLEGAEAKLQSLAAKNVRKGTTPAGADPESPDIVSRYVPLKKRPAHRLGFLGLLGKKVDTLEYAPEFIQKKNDELARERASLANYPLANSAFIRFSRQIDAHSFAAGVHKASGKRTMSVATDVIPEDVIWHNLSMSPAQRTIRTVVSWAGTIGLIIIWAPLVAFVGVVSNISTICSTVSFLNWICKLPGAVVGIIQGILPPVLLAVLFMLLPIYLRTLIKLQGEPRFSTVERKLWNRFWLFQIIHGFLIIAIASGLTKSLNNIGKEAAQIPTKLATNLPGSAIFFLTFILTVTLGSATKTFSRAVPFLMTKFAFILRGNAPRKAFKYDFGMSAIALSTAWPPIALLAVIALVYTVVQPVIVGFACVGFILLYLTYKYMLTWVCEQPVHLETNGFYYPYALGAIFAALYVEEIFLAALFFLRKTTVGYIFGAIMIVVGVLTVGFQIWIDRRTWKAATYLGTASKILGGESTENLNPPPPRPLSVDAGEQAFDHPATWRDGPVIWIVDDVLGIGRSEAARINGYGIATSTEGARMGEDGKTIIERGPPDQPWYDEKAHAPLTTTDVRTQTM
ncbi:DUF221-domain-containing protein [Exidia glandulosa HHB12029]|uniref:DUF221-domain-containing protein n=1 Tax=Exidia glandulosa HHB12029 TaxID=1314781 RepID=A0A165CMZ0_EXIGL|nr:DUF221-domain-containing protein [Exidia glandulosa HHB12029]